MTPNLALARCWCSNLLTGNQIKQLLQAWLTPADPSTNHNIARKASHKGTAVWFFQGKIVIEWKSTGSLLWIHGKRAFLSAMSGSGRLTDPDFGSGVWEKRHLVCYISPRFLSELILLQFLHHSRHYGCMQRWIDYYGLFLLRFQGRQQARLS